MAWSHQAPFDTQAGGRKLRVSKTAVERSPEPRIRAKIKRATEQLSPRSLQAEQVWSEPRWPLKTLQDAPENEDWQNLSYGEGRGKYVELRLHVEIEQMRTAFLKLFKPSPFSDELYAMKCGARPAGMGQLIAKLPIPRPFLELVWLLPELEKLKPGKPANRNWVYDTGAEYL